VIERTGGPRAWQGARRRTRSRESRRGKEPPLESSTLATHPRARHSHNHTALACRVKFPFEETASGNASIARSWNSCERCFMLADTKLSEFLWEPAVAHPAYVRNGPTRRPSSGRRHTSVGWENGQNVTHLREFGAPMDPKRVLSSHYCTSRGLGRAKPRPSPK
jgi:hypothetical protein